MALALLKLDDGSSTNLEPTMSNRIALTQAAKQPPLDDLLMGDVDLDLMFGVDSDGDDDLDDLQCQPQWIWPAPMLFGGH